MTDSVKGALLTMFGGMCWGVSGCVGQYLFTDRKSTRLNSSHIH